MSRHHAVLLYVNGKLYVQDLGSRNGTMLNGVLLQPLQMTQLHIGEEVCFGITKFLITDLRSGSPSAPQVDTIPLNTLLKAELVAAY